MFPPSDPLAAVPPSPAVVQPSAPSPDSPDALRASLNTLEMSSEQVGEWWKRIERARTRRKQYEDIWDILLKEYLPTVKESGTPESIKVNTHFRNVQTKIGQLFPRTPEIQTTPEGRSLDATVDPLTNLPITAERAVQIKQAVLKWYLGPDCIDAGHLMDECLFDIMAWAGLAATKIGYTATMKSFQEPVMQPDPDWQPPGVGVISLRLGASSQPPMVPAVDPTTGAPLMQTKQALIHEEWYWDRFSPKKLLFNDDLHSTRFDEQATWMGQDFFMPVKEAMATYGLTEDEATRCTADDRVFKHEGDTAAGSSPGRDLAHGVEVFVKASLFRSDERHPQAMDHLVLIEGLRDRTVVYRPSPDQSFDDRGRLTPDSMIGFPIHVITIRDLADSPFPPADSAFTNAQVKHLNTFRRQGVMRRDASIGKYLFDPSMLDDADVDKMKHGAVGEAIAVKPGAMAGGSEKIWGTTAQVHDAPDNWREQAAIKQELDETLGINSGSAGTPLDTVRSATEIAAFTSAGAGRQEKEQSRAIAAYLRGVRKLDALIQRYAPTEEYVNIVGEDGTRELVKWNKAIIYGKYSYDITPDTNLRVDAAQDRQQTLAYYNLVAKDPFTNRKPILRRLARRFGFDPAQVVLPDQAVPMQPQHGGEAERVVQHQAEQSGGKPNAPESQGNDRQARML